MHRATPGAILLALGLIVIGDAVALHAQGGGYGIAPVHAVGVVPTSAAPAHTPALARRQPLPMSVQIPAIGVTSPMEAVYLGSHGELTVPADVRDTGWWAQGVRPADPGPAVLVGHVDSYTGPGVFVHARDLRPGQAIRVSRIDGSVAIFSVDGIREYNKDHFPTAVVYGATRRAELRLVTCGGSFDLTTRHYRDNVVVFAHLTKITKAGGTAAQPRVLRPVPTATARPKTVTIPGPAGSTNRGPVRPPAIPSRPAASSTRPTPRSSPRATHAASSPSSPTASARSQR